VEEDLEQELDNLIDISEDTLNSRLNLIRARLNNYYDVLRNKIDEKMSEEELVNSDVYKSCLIISNIISLSNKDEDNSEFNRLLYIMWEGCKGNLMNLLAQFDIQIIKTESEGYKFNFVINEPKGELDG